MLEKILKAINAIGVKSVTVAIDGRCAAGKSTLARALSEKIDCNVFHTDDFFLRPEQRTSARYAAPGENVDHERFLEEVLLPLERGTAFSYRPYDAHLPGFKAPIQVAPKKVNIVEGSYCCNQNLINHYDLRIFLDISHELQMRRIIARNGIAAAKMFESRWIPLEEAYFAAFNVKNKCELYFKCED